MKRGSSWDAHSHQRLKLMELRLMQLPWLPQTTQLACFLRKSLSYQVIDRRDHHFADQGSKAVRYLHEYCAHDNLALGMSETEGQNVC